MHSFAKCWAVALGTTRLRTRPFGFCRATILPKRWVAMLGQACCRLRRLLIIQCVPASCFFFLLAPFFSSQGSPVAQLRCGPEGGHPFRVGESWGWWRTRGNGRGVARWAGGAAAHANRNRTRCPAPWAFPPSLRVLESRANKFRVLAIAEAGDTVTADHLQMASLAAEHKPTVLGIPGQVPIPYQLECTVVLLQSLHALFQLLTTGSTLQHCPQAAGFAVALGTAARQDNGHIVSMASSLALALRSATHLKIAVVHKENPAGRAITKLLTAFDLEPDHQRYFIRPVSREEAETNTACTAYDLRASDAASYIPGCHVVIVTTGLVWDQKGQTHSTLNTHMENVDLLISEESVTVHLQRPLQSGSGSPGRTSCWSRLCSHQPGQPARLPTGAECGREIGSGKPAPLEFNVANERKGCPRSV